MDGEKRRRIWPWILLGGLGGMVLTAILTVAGMRTLMIEEYSSPHDVDETVKRLEAAITSRGWSIPKTMDFNASVAKQGESFSPKVRMIKLCKAEHAVEVLADARAMACLMPCTFAVYEDDAGGVKVSKMNTGLMGKLFGGTLARVMGGPVSEDEAAMLTEALGNE